jgi:hypothetical protein
MVKYELRAGVPLLKIGEYNTLEDAKWEALSHPGYQEIITWAVNPNLPGASPSHVYSSCSMLIMEAGSLKWEALNIHGTP